VTHSYDDGLFSHSFHWINSNRYVDVVFNEVQFPALLRVFHINRVTKFRWIRSIIRLPHFISENISSWYNWSEFQVCFYYVLFSNNFDISTRDYVSVSALMPWHKAIWLRRICSLCSLCSISAVISFLHTAVSLLVSFVKVAACATCWSLVGRSLAEYLCVI
jgi:hypothetical protein